MDPVSDTDLLPPVKTGSLGVAKTGSGFEAADGRSIFGNSVRLLV